MLGEVTDFTLLLHAALLAYLAVMIYRAARSKSGETVWRRWPPDLLVLWSLAAMTDGIVYMRRWLDQVIGWDLARYKGGLSFILNVVSLIAIALLIWRIRRGDDPPKKQVWPPAGRGTV